jgi:hypothetical protein
MNRSNKVRVYVTALTTLYLVAPASVFADEATSKTYKAESGPDGAKISKTKTSLQGNPDGSVSANRSHESHTVSDGGSAHHTSNSSTQINPDGSTSTVKQDAKSTTP